jgi:sugar transferase (PEP-CTERM system associated)
MAIRIFDHYLHAPVIVLVLTEFLLAMSAPLLAVGAIGLFHGTVPDVTAGAAFAFAIVVIFGLASMGLYRVGLRASFAGVMARIVTGMVLAGLGLAFFYYINRSFYIEPLTLLVAVIILLLGLGIVRLAFHRMVDEDLFKRRVLVYGAGKRAEAFLKLRRRADQRGFILVNYIRTASDGDSGIDPDQVIDMPDDLCAYAVQHDIDEVVVAVDDRRQSFPVRPLLECRLQGLDVTDILGFLERETGKVDLRLMRPSYLIFSNGFRRQLTRRILQRIFDLVCSVIGLVLASPIMVLTAIAIVAEDGLPIFYRQRRVGRGNVPFNVLKFRSMRRDAESGGKAVWAKADDDRVTRVGRVIRKLRFDELPQLLNVLRGQMSLVGPRPERPEFVETLSKNIPYYLERHRVNPGITGWAQLCYPYGSSEKDAFEKLQYDLYYVKNRTLLFDLMILMQTAEVVLWQKGAR